MKNESFSEITLILRCVICRKEHKSHKYFVKGARTNLIEMLNKTRQDGWTIGGGQHYYTCSECSSMPNIKESLENINLEMPVIEVKAKRMPNELTTEEIEELARKEQ
jgi:hypothetical protein